MGKRNIKENVGDIIKIPFKKDLHTYGRILIDESYAIYDIPSSTDRTDFENIIKSDILFTAYVDLFAVKEGFWTIVGNLPLEEKLKKYYPRYFNPAPTNPTNVTFYNMHKEEVEEAIKKDWVKTANGLQIDGIHGREHIESRLNDYYDGKRNEFNNRDIWLFKKSLGLPVEDTIK